ncbi:unnamed protein product [Dicrocoelium dendriticum]|nr:unnamed protein product [Dicrocoelium dendriticum]
MQFHLQDNTPLNHVVGSLSSVKDLEYPLTPAILSPDDLFKLTTNGNVFKRNALDRDEICDQFRCCDSPVCHIGIYAYLFDSKSIPMALNVGVIISDENDKALSFPISNTRLQSTSEQVCEISVPESAPVGSRYPLIMAVDRDSPSYSLQNYQLLSVRSEADNFVVSGSPFSLIVPTYVSKGIKHWNAPELQLDLVLDRETKIVYEFVLVAEDATPFIRNATLPIRVSVKYMNDYAPIFLNLSSDAILKIPDDIPTGPLIHHFSISDPDEGPTEIHLNENVPKGTELALSLGFLDPDLGGNGTVHSSILSVFNQAAEKLTTFHSPPFRILNYSRLFTCGDIDDETHPRIILALLAEDQGNAFHLSSTVSLTAMVDELNDNTSYMVQSHKNESYGHTVKSAVVLPLNSPAYTLVITISASDVNAGDKRRVTYQLLGEERTDVIDGAIDEFIERSQRDFTGTEFVAGSYYFYIDEHTVK